MKRHFSSAVLSLLLLLNLTACGGDVVMNQGSHSAVLEGYYGASSELVDLPVLDQEDVNQSASKGDNSVNQNSAEGNDTVNQGDLEGNKPAGKTPDSNRILEEDGWYDSKEEVALYIHLYGELPDNYVTKDEAQDAGWSGGNVEYYTGEGTALGGTYFGNYEGLLPKEKGRSYTECDIDTVGENSRGAKRIVYSNDGLIYYTEDHYESFELLYGEP